MSESQEKKGADEVPEPRPSLKTAKTHQIQRETAKETDAVLDGHKDISDEVAQFLALSPAELRKLPEKPVYTITDPNSAFRDEKVVPFPMGHPFYYTLLEQLDPGEGEVLVFFPKRKIHPIKVSGRHLKIIIENRDGEKEVKGRYEFENAFGVVALADERKFLQAAQLIVSLIQRSNTLTDAMRQTHKVEGFDKRIMLRLRAEEVKIRRPIAEDRQHREYHWRRLKITLISNLFDFKANLEQFQRLFALIVRKTNSNINQSVTIVFDESSKPEDFSLPVSPDEGAESLEENNDVEPE